ncbi:hypothetical protein [Actinomyces naeslundii]|uniref:hypothetical protein n=1 Tax=Actinomyces naeslundii TaxID=1655 RepID=UPI0028EDB35C|nr:hypothetical protein [Actinomyces naeslundii]
MTHPKTPDSPHSLHRILTLKTALLAVSFTLAGILLLMLNAWLDGLELGSWAWVRALPVSEVGGTLLAAGLIGTVLDMAVRRDQEASVRAQFRRVLPCRTSLRIGAHRWSSGGEVISLGRLMSI